MVSLGLPLFQVERDLEMADAYLASGLVSDGAELYERHLESALASRAHIGLAKCAYHRREFHEALGYLQAVSVIEPGYPDLANCMGAVLFGMGLEDEAREAFEVAVAEQPDNLVGLSNLAELCMKAEDFEACAEACRQILQLVPGDRDTTAMLQEAEAAASQGSQGKDVSRPLQAPPMWAGVPETVVQQIRAAIPPSPDAPAESRVAPEPAASPEADMPAESRAALEPVASPDHIEGVVVVPREAHVDDRGYLIEIFRSTDPHFTRFGQVYLVGDIKAGTIRAFHKHERMWDWFFISHGTAKFVLKDDRSDSPTHGNMKTIVCGDRCPAMVTVPPGVYHGWMALADDTQLVSIASEVYDRTEPDEERIPPDSFGDVWTVKGR